MGDGSRSAPPSASRADCRRRPTKAADGDIRTWRCRGVKRPTPATSPQHGPRSAEAMLCRRLRRLLRPTRRRMPTKVRRSRSRARPRTDTSSSAYFLVPYALLPSFLITTPCPYNTEVVVRFKAVGNAPIMKQNFYKITASNRFQAVIQFLRKELGWKQGDPLVSSFHPFALSCSPARGDRRVLTSRHM